MSLKSDFQNMALDIITAFDDVPLIVTFTVFGEKTYNDLTDVITTPQTDYTGIKMFFMKFSDSEVQNSENIIATDIKGLVAGVSLPGIKPSPGNRVTVTSSSDDTFRSGDVFEVVGDFKTDPAEALLEIHLRAVA